MKHKATIDLEFTNADLFEQEVIKAMHAYAKTIAREAFQNEIKSCVEETARRCSQRLYDGRYTDPLTDTMVKEVVHAYIEKQMSSETIQELMRSSLTRMETELQDEAIRRIRGETEKYLSSAFVKNLINGEIHKAIPQAVVDVLMKASDAAVQGREVPQEGRNA